MQGLARRSFASFADAGWGPISQNVSRLPLEKRKRRGGCGG